MKRLGIFAVAVTASLYWMAAALAQFPGSAGSGQIPIGQGTPLPLWMSMLGDCSIVAGGTITCTKTNGVPFYTGLPAPVNPSDAATKQYVDSTGVGLNIHQQVRLGTTAALPTNTYNNGASGVGATLTATSNGALVIDTTSAANNDRILVKNETSAQDNGIYVVTSTGDASHAYILTRATDANTPGVNSPNLIGFGTFALVTAGSVNANTGWTVNSQVTTIGTSAITWVQFTGTGGVTSLNSLTGSLNLSPGTAMGPFSAAGSTITLNSHPWQVFVITATNASWSVAGNFGYTPSELVIEAWGGGASGAGQNGGTCTSRGAGGGGGQYFWDHYTSAMDSTLNITIGAGGTSCSSFCGGVAGGNTSVVGSNLGTLTAHGGSNNGCSGPGCAGGAGGTGATGATFAFDGGGGGATFSNVCNYFGFGGDAPRGGLGGKANVSTNGAIPGGGGSGENHSGGGSGAGARGEVIIYGR